jgi:hypothetical protein
MSGSFRIHSGGTMSSKNISRICLRDERTGSIHRVFSVYFEHDYLGDEYMKVMLPDFLGLKMVKSEEDDKYRFMIDGHGQVSSMPSFREFSYHFKSGVSHFKSEQPIDQKLQLPTLADAKVLQVCRIGIADLTDIATKTPDALDANDIILEKSFDGAPRSVNIFISILGSHVEVRNANMQDYGLLAGYRPNITSTAAQVIITDNQLLNPTAFSGVSIFRPNDPVRCHRP